MRIFRGVPLLFGIMGLLLGALVLACCVLGGTMEPKMLFASDGAARCAEALMDRLCRGDYAGASACCLGNPALDPTPRTETEKQLWQAFSDSLEYTLVGSSYATAQGVAQDVTFRSLLLPGVTRNLRQRAEKLLERRVAEAKTMAEVYEEDLSYREDFLRAVLSDAVAEAIDADGRCTEQRLTLHLICDRGRWQVMPDAAWMNAVCGGIPG